MAAAADPAAPDAPPSKKGSKLPLLLGLALAVAGGAGGFLAVQAGVLGGGGAEAGSPAEADSHGGSAGGHGGGHGEAPVAAFVPLPPLTVNVAGGDRFLRFAGQVEVDPAHLEEVTALTPRIVDVLNGYLRAVEPADLGSPAALMAIRSQLLRRVQVVAGGEAVRDLLVMEFVVN